MLTSKQRAFLRAQSNKLDTAYQIGKDGLSENSLIQINEYLEAHELLKVHVQNSLDTDIKRLADETAAAVRAELVQVLGKRFVLYRYSPKLAQKGKALVFEKH